MTQYSLSDRITGCLFAGALGDAIGAYYEGQSSGADFEVPTDLSITDDTQLTIATCESIIQSGEVQPESIANRMVEWFRERRITGIGSSTLKALVELDAGGHWALVGASGECSAGNGAAMRIAPLAFMLDPDVDSERQTIRDVCRITHRNDEAYIGALAVVRTIGHVIKGNSLNAELLPSLISTLPDSRVRDRFMAVDDQALTLEEYASQFKTDGYVVNSVPLAILAAFEADDLLETIEKIVQCGGDTDTIASMFGQIYGAAHGTDVLPMPLVDQIDEVTLIRKTAIDFSNIISTKQGNA
ncbi:MAG: hypothetical protein COA78_21435 [Blastopirellula sp.]|nr:MAG: hypothetical protein COA78_21435 [Blastopirellula sp.]